MRAEWTGFALPAWDILFFVTFHFQLNYSFLVGRLGLAGLGFSIKVSVTF